MSTRRPAPRPKRGGEEFARTHYLDDDGPSAKKIRFDTRNPSALAPDAPENDAILEADEIGKRGQHAKRNAVNIDGYDSDSSNEGFDARAATKAKEAEKNGKIGPESKDEEQGDMFADLDEGFKDGDEDEEVRGEGKKQSKNVRFLEEDEIEGQVASSKGGGHVSADFSVSREGLGGPNAILRSKDGDHEGSSSESDVDDEERAELGDVDEELGAGSKKEHAPKLDAFNMKSEQEEGRFDAQGNFVRKAADSDAVFDSWLEGVSKKDMKKAKDAADRRDQERREQDLLSDAMLTSEILNRLLPHLERGETILEALARLGRGKAKKKPKWQNKTKAKRNGAEAMDVEEPEDPAETRRRKAVEAITNAANQLLTRGQPEVYDAEKEALMRQYLRDTGEEWVDPPQGDDAGDGSGATKQWEYRWSDARDGGEAHGPYDGPMMVSWKDAGYFGDGVEFRRVGENSEWSRAVDFL